MSKLDALGGQLAREDDTRGGNTDPKLVQDRLDEALEDAQELFQGLDDKGETILTPLRTNPLKIVAGSRLPPGGAEQGRHSDGEPLQGTLASFRSFFVTGNAGRPKRLLAPPVRPSFLQFLGALALACFAVHSAVRMHRGEAPHVLWARDELALGLIGCKAFVFHWMECRFRLDEEQSA